MQDFRRNGQSAILQRQSRCGTPFPPQPSTLLRANRHARHRARQSGLSLAKQQAALQTTQLNLGYTTLIAPVDGTSPIAPCASGNMWKPAPNSWPWCRSTPIYVTANYKETALTNVHRGEPVTVDVDTFPGEPVHGVVNSVAPASGEEFSLLPPDNATGNFIKIVQRIPVKITIDPHDPLIGRLRPGMSVESTIDTRHA